MLMGIADFFGGIIFAVIFDLQKTIKSGKIVINID